MLRTLVLVVVSWLCIAWGRPARADPALYSPYEKNAIRRELAARGWEEEPAPQGKTISEIDIVTLEVFDETDPVPDFFNVFHATTRKRVIRRELLFEEGEEFSQRRIDETARNLKQLVQLSMVIFVPARDPDSKRVRVLVITKDVWSLRMNSNLQVGNEGLTYLLLNPTETNMAGTHASFGGLFILKRSTYSTGAMASHNRIMGSRLAGSLAASVVFNRQTGDAEGSFGAFTYGLPRYSEKQRWLYATLVSWDDGIVRVSRKDAPGILLPYHRELYLGSNSVTRSFGVHHKLELSLGAEVDRRVYHSRVGAEVDGTVRRSFEREDLPLSDMRVSPFVQVASFENRFLKTIELETLGLQEDFRLGPQTVLKVYPASSKVGSSRDLLGVLATAAYTAKLGDGLARLIATSNIQYAKDDKHHAVFSLMGRVASPRLGFGRLILDGWLENRHQNYLRARSAIGGEGRLRGYVASDTEVKGGDSQRGGDLVVFNAEFRSPGIDILSAQCGLAAFHDIGGVAPSDHFDRLVWKESVGVGLRILFPQADRIVFRGDWGFPLSPGYQTFPGSFVVTVAQAFPMPEVQ